MLPRLPSLSNQTARHSQASEAIQKVKIKNLSTKVTKDTKLKTEEIFIRWHANRIYSYFMARFCLVRAFRTQGHKNLFEVTFVDRFFCFFSPIKKAPEGAFLTL
jgi:hypothetical protein